MAKAAAKQWVSVPGDLAKTVRKRVGARGLSGYVTRAIRHELEREQLGAFVTELDEELGAVSKSLAAVRAAWRSHGPGMTPSRYIAVVLERVTRRERDSAISRRVDEVLAQPDEQDLAPAAHLQAARRDEGTEW